MPAGPLQPSGMHDLRTSTALRQLADLDDGPNVPVWSWAVVALETSGRVRLPADACAVLSTRPGDSVEVRGVCRRDALVLRAAGDGRLLMIDRRGRLYVPAWVRRGDVTSMIVGTHHVERVVVLATATAFDPIGEALIGTSR